MKKYKCKCREGWTSTKPHSLVETMCLICNGRGWVTEERAEAYNIPTTKKNEFEK